MPQHSLRNGAWYLSPSPSLRQAGLFPLVFVCPGNPPAGGREKKTGNVHAVNVSPLRITLIEGKGTVSMSVFLFGDMISNVVFM